MVKEPKHLTKDEKRREPDLFGLYKRCQRKDLTAAFPFHEDSKALTGAAAHRDSVVPILGQFQEAIALNWKQPGLTTWRSRKLD